MAQPRQALTAVNANHRRPRESQLYDLMDSGFETAEAGKLILENSLVNWPSPCEVKGWVTAKEKIT